MSIVADQTQKVRGLCHATTEILGILPITFFYEIKSLFSDMHVGSVGCRSGKNGISVGRGVRVFCESGSSPTSCRALDLLPVGLEPPNVELSLRPSCYSLGSLTPRSPTNYSTSCRAGCILYYRLL